MVIKRTVIVGCLGCSLISAHAEEKLVDLGAMEIATSGAEGTTSSAPPSNYESFDPLDSGRSVVVGDTISASREGGTDTTSLLQPLPFVQMDTERQSAEAEDLQSLRPSDFSISGGNYYDNSVLIDGVSATSIMDVSTQNANDFNEVSGQTSQTLYVDPTLIGSMEVIDSNVSARHGDFTGGVVDIQLRQPARKFGVSATAGFQNDSMVSYRKSGNGELTRSEPDFSKYQTSVAVDTPLSDKLFVLAAISQSESAVKYNMDEAYGGTRYETGDKANNVLFKALYEYNPDLSLEGQLIYSPYRSEKQPDNSINSLNTNHTDGLSSYLALNGISGERSWQHKVSYQVSDTSRDWDGDRYAWPSKAESIDWCSDGNCMEGGFGDLNQTQKDSVYQFTVNQPVGGGNLSLGGELRYTEARKQRPEDNYYYSSGKVMATGVDAQCAIDDSACREDVALSQYSYYQAYDAEVDLFSQALWLEYLRSVGHWEFRTGARLSHDDFLDNYNLAPRLTANWEFFDDTFLTLGANRYYAANMVGYAIRSQYPDNYTYRRSVNTSTGEIGDWSLLSHVRATDYGQGELKTPYSDELTAALTFPAPLDGHFRIKSIYRFNRDSFASTSKTSEEFNSDTGKTLSTTLYSMTNDGKSDYKGLALEWDGQITQHSFNANVTWSETKSYGKGSTYFDYTDPQSQVYYNGRVIDMNELYDLNDRSNFAAPLRAAVGWTARWTQRWMTNASVQYRGSYEYLGDSGDNIDIDGDSYDVYDTIKIKSFTTMNVNTRYQFFQWQNQKAATELRITNLFNSTPHSASNSAASYRLGRSIWLGVNYVY
ncbi:TonB-dependent receptor plug domain-containing protein [Pseudaeromonas sharmana]|uniref:TonB-dependent receptor plug domain-containing protein n=1 Tax=Pseudaeromonas sharmana TaxID=328412 RepID=A0ABV8CP38_9GAMM